MVEVYRLADELGVSTVEIISAMEKLDIPFQLPNPSVSIDDAQKIKASFKKGSGFSFKNISFFIAAVFSLTFVLSINSDRVFADDTAPPPVATASEPTVSSLLAFKEQVVVASEAIRDSFTVMVQEKLIDLGLLSGPATGINDKVTQEAIKSFQEKAGLEKIDGMVGPETLPKLLQGEAAYTTTATSTSNENGPVWGDDQLQFMRVNGTYMDVLWGHITHDKPIDTFQLYVDGELHTTLDANDCMNSCSSTSGDMRFKINGLAVETTYEFEVVACDSDNNCSANNPTTTQSTVDKPPVWDESLPLTVSELGTRLNLNIPVGAVTDDVDVAYYEVYVNGALSTFRTISDTRLFVLPKYNTHCGPQELYVLAYDSVGQFSKSPVVDFTRNSMTSLECSVVTSSGSTTTTTTVPTGKLADCGDSTTSANRWVVSVIDEDSSFGNPNAVWNSFRGSYPDRCFHLLGPGTAVPSASLKTGQLSYNGVSWGDEVTAGTAFRYIVNRDSGITANRSDWWDLIGADVLPSGAKIALCVDNSGSMTIATVQASVNYFVEQATAAGVTIFAPSAGGFTNYNCNGMPSEDWITGHIVAMD